MYAETITLFNKHIDSTGIITWYPHVLVGVDVIADKAANMAQTGLESADTVKLHVRYTHTDGAVSDSTIPRMAALVADEYHILSDDDDVIELVEGDCLVWSIDATKIGGYAYLPPREWAENPAAGLTFNTGDFFIVGKYAEDTVSDADYCTRTLGGFYDHMNKTYDHVYMITNVGGPYTLIPHFEIGGR